MSFILKLFGLFKKEKSGKSFGEFSAAEKKALIKSAAREANKMQKDLVEEYDRRFGQDKKRKANSNYTIAMG